jgi:GDP/UDP-N,N'-diacetylbacillosamine 2-epimerase (hydrolysing)
MHLSEYFGLTVREIEAAGLTVAERIPVAIESATGAAMAQNLALTLAGCVKAFEKLQPDIVLLLGDRGEMLAGAIAAIHLNIPIVHLHGGERSGTVDEPVRHAISKLSHYHFVATVGAKERLERMGERADRIFVTGAPGLDGLRALATLDRTVLCQRLGLQPTDKIALFLYHAVLQESPEIVAQEAGCLLEGCLQQGLQVIALMPNADAGSDVVHARLEAEANNPRVRVLTHLPRQEFVSWMAVCDVMVGNSSSGIIEAGSFGVPVVNMGMRQHMRERNPNVLDADCSNLEDVLKMALAKDKTPHNLYGDGYAGERIAEHLKTIDISHTVLLKTNVY